MMKANSFLQALFGSRVATEPATPKGRRFFLGNALVAIGGFASVAAAQETRLRKVTPSQYQAEVRSGHWEVWGSLTASHPYTVNSAALNAFPPATPPPFGHHYEPKGQGPFTSDQLLEKGYTPQLYHFDPAKVQVWLGMRNALSDFRNDLDKGFGPVPGYGWMWVWVDSLGQPQFYGGYGPAGIKACLNPLPIIWLYVYDDEPQAPAAPKKCVPQKSRLTGRRRANPETGEPEVEWTNECCEVWVPAPCEVGERKPVGEPYIEMDGLGQEWVIQKFWNNCAPGFDRCLLDSFSVGFIYGVKDGRIGKGKKRRLHELTDDRDSSRKLEAREYDFIEKNLKLDKDDKVKALIVLLGACDDRIVVWYFTDGWHWKEFLLGVAVGIGIGWFLPRGMCKIKDVVPIKEYVPPGPGAGSGNYAVKAFKSIFGF